jgi:hypothetical protein
MEHFIKHTRVMKDKPVLHLLDSQPLLLDIKVLELAKENRAVMSFLVYTSHKLQPLQRSVDGSEIILRKL